MKASEMRSVTNSTSTAFTERHNHTDVGLTIVGLQPRFGVIVSMGSCPNI